MSKYDSELYKKWYNLNKDRIRDSKRVAKKKYRRTEAGKLAQKKYNQKPTTKLRFKKYHFFIRYGITLDEYENMLLDRNNLCDICASEMKYPHIDHDHVTGKIRGVLCGNCNMALGLFKDDLNRFKLAIKYLERNV